MIESENTQVIFFQQLKESLPPNVSLAEEVSELLNVSTDSAYRRMRGETVLSIDELKKLCLHYRISLDSLINNTVHSITFKYKPIENTEQSLEEYLNLILKDLKNVQAFDNPKIIFAAKDIPVFHHFQFKELTAFKLFYWMKSVINIPALENKTFEPKLIPNNFLKIAEDILKTYLQIPSVEIWTEETITSTLTQIKYYWEAGLFKNKNDVGLILDQVSEMITHVKKETELSLKYFYRQKPIGREGNFTFYHSDIIFGNNNIQAQMGDTKLTYLTHNSFNSLITTNQPFCEETDLWLKNLMKKSNLISGVSEKQRNQFFQLIQNKVEELRTKTKT